MVGPFCPSIACPDCVEDFYLPETSCVFSCVYEYMYGTSCNTFLTLCHTETVTNPYVLLRLTGGAPNLGSNPLRLLTTQPQQMPSTPPIFSSSNSNTPQNSLGKNLRLIRFYCVFVAFVYFFTSLGHRGVICKSFGVSSCHRLS